MGLTTQISTLIFSLIYGIIFSFLLSINYKIIYGEKKLVKIIYTFSFVIGSILIYFIGIQKINSGLFHPYSALVIILGFIIEQILHSYVIKLIAKFKKKWYTCAKVGGIINE